MTMMMSSSSSKLMMMLLQQQRQRRSPRPSSSTKKWLSPLFEERISSSISQQQQHKFYFSISSGDNDIIMSSWERRYRYNHHHHHHRLSPFNNNIIQQQQQQQYKRWKSSSSSSSSSSMSTTASQLILDDDDDDDEEEEEEEGDVVPSSTPTSIDMSSSEPQKPIKIPWLISNYGPFSQEIQNEAPILRSSSSETVQKEWKIPHPDDIAGIVFLGPNGIGKSQLIQSIIQQGGSCEWYTGEEEDNDDAINTSNTTSRRPIPKWKPRIQHVSFEAHQELLNGDKNLGVLKCIADGGQLNKAAQFLIVRLGLYPLLKRNVITLSTGEIRKVMLVRALSRRPDLLILDNALDGLDIKSRNNLKDIINKTLQGFKQDILVQGINAKATARTQIMMLTHRSEEIIVTTIDDDDDDVESTVTYPVLMTTTTDDDDDSNNSSMELKTESINGRSGDDLLSLAMNMNMNMKNLHENGEEGEHVVEQQLYPWDDPTLTVSEEMIKSWWQSSSSSSSSDMISKAAEPIVKANKLSIIRRTKKIDNNENDDGGSSQSNVITLLDDLDWSIFPGDAWLLAGHNGAGKSTLSRLLVKQQQQQQDDDDDEYPDTLDDNLIVPDPSQIGWCSTELHMQMSSSTKPTIEVLTRDYTTDTSIAMQMSEWMRLPTTTFVDDDKNPESSFFWNRPFHQLSQGQQKMVLITAAIACQPRLLILDEPCQGLDLFNRRRVLSMMELLCQCDDIDMSLIYITHHPDEWIPSIQQVLHLQNGKSIYDGSMSDYDPEGLLVSSNNNDDD